MQQSKYIYHLAISLFFLLLAGYGNAQTTGRVVDLKCEHLSTPLGIDNPKPRLSWRMEDNSQGAFQSAYQVIVGLDSVEVLKTKSAQKISKSDNLITYDYAELKPFTRYFWKVIAWNQDGKELKHSAVASFETGMMGMANWKGYWLSDVYNTDVNLKAAPYFRKTFKSNKKIKSARAYIAVAGLYELSINGQKIGNHRLDPIYTRFDRRTLYVTHDVTSALRNGENAIGVLLGNGWYNHQSTAVWNFHNAPWRNRPTFCMDVRITYADGTTETVITDNSWKTSLSPVIFNSIYTAEHQDFRLEQVGWNKPGFDDKNWKRVYYRPVPSNNVVSQQLHPIRNVERIPAVSMKKLNDTTYVYDLGRNISGVSEFRIGGPAGSEIRLKHGERLKADDHVDLSNIDVHYRPTDDKDPFQTDIFYLSGKELDVFMPHFNYKGFQYVEVTCPKGVYPSRTSLIGHFTHSDVPPIGTISSSNPIIDKIWEATNNSYLSNLMGYPTDCPQREKNGWTGDAHIASETGLYSFDAFTIYEKWMADHRDEQQPNGVLPSIIPTGGWGYEWGNGPDWTSTIAIIPWNLYLFTGDKKPLIDNYEALKKYVNHIDEVYPSGITSWGLGDWVPVRSKASVELTSTAYYFRDVEILIAAAIIQDKFDEVMKYGVLQRKIYSAFNKKFYKPDSSIYGSGFQTELAVPLHFGLIPEAHRNQVAANLAASVKKENFHLDVGLLGTKSILEALSENGYADIAYKLVAQETYPSWGWWMKNGATTLYENWDIQAENDISLNHIMFGAIGGWLYKGIGGIWPDTEKPGFQKINLRPHFVLDKFYSSHLCPQGEIISEWYTSEGIINYSVTIPPGSFALFSIDHDMKVIDGITKNNEVITNRGETVLGSGTWKFKLTKS